MHKFDEDLRTYQVVENMAIETDGHIGIPVEISVFFVGKNKIMGGPNGTPIIFYVMGVQIPRIGTDSDTEIIKRMLDRGYVVVTVDYLNNSKAVPPALDWSVQRLRAWLMNDDFFNGLADFPENSYMETFVVPTGYDISLNNVFWSIDKHSSDGTLEKIAEIWNNDFRGVHGEKIIKWTNSDGMKKNVQNAFDGTAPLWLNADGTENMNGEYIKIKHTKAESITDCVHPDGTPLNLDLCMHIIYPTNPVSAVPVMCLANSAEHMASCAANSERPQFNGFVFRGYAGVMYDYAYTPMARTEHYGYFDGNNYANGSVTGDNVTYSIQFYNDKKINTAAMRFIRYLALSDKRFCFKQDSIGVFGNSKGGWMTFLGEEHPETFKEARFFPKHHGESRYDNGKTKPQGNIRGGEEQPWLTFDSKTLDSGADFIYAGCGGAEDFITKNHCPTYIAGNMKDGSYLGRSNSMVNLCRIYDIPSIFLEIDLGHSLARGNDVNYGVDSYEALFKLTDFYLKNEALEVLYTVPANGAEKISTVSPIIIKFTGGVSSEEIKNITVIDSKGEKLCGEWSSMYGDTEWTYKPKTSMNNGELYTVSIPNSLQGNNGRVIGESYALSFKTQCGVSAVSSVKQIVTSDNSAITKITIPDNTAQKSTILRVFVENDAANVLQIYTVKNGNIPDNLIGEINIRGTGAYEIDITKHMSGIVHENEIALLMVAAKKADTVQIFSEALAENLGGGAMGECMRYEFAKTPDEKNALKISGIMTNKRFVNNEFYTNTELYGYDSIVYESGAFLKNVSEKDYGRRFNIRFSVYDTVSRKMKAELNSCTNKELFTADYNRNMYNIQTDANCWSVFEFNYVVYDSMYGEAGEHDKFLIVKAESTGDVEAPFYIADVSVTETITDINIGEVSVFIGN